MATITVADGGQIVATLPAAPSGATGYRLYVAVAPGSITRLLAFVGTVPAVPVTITGLPTAHTIGSTGTVPAKIGTVSDNFDGLALDARKWIASATTGMAATQTGGQIVLTATTGASTGGYAYLETLPYLDARESAVALEYATPSTDPLVPFSLTIYGPIDFASYVTLRHVPGTALRLVSAVAASETVRASATFGAVAHRWWRLRLVGGTWLADTSADSQVWVHPDGLGDAATAWRWASPFGDAWHAQCYPLISIDIPGSVPVATRTVAFDNLNAPLGVMVPPADVVADPALARAVEPIANTTAPVGVIWGRSDDETGNIPIPVPQVAPASAYSWPKSFRLAVAPGGDAGTTITNLAIQKASTEAGGLRLFCRAAPGVDDPLVAPAATAGASGSLGTGNYRLSYSFTTDAGETATSPQLVVAVTSGQRLNVGAVTPPAPAAPYVRTIRWYASEAPGSTVLRLAAENTGGAFTIDANPTGATPPPVPGYVQPTGIAGSGAGQYPPNDFNPRSGAVPNTPAGWTPIPADPPLVFDPRALVAPATGGFGYVLRVLVGAADKSSAATMSGIADVPGLIFSYDETA